MAIWTGDGVFLLFMSWQLNPPAPVYANLFRHSYILLNNNLVEDQHNVLVSNFKHDIMTVIYNIPSSCAFIEMQQTFAANRSSIGAESFLISGNAVSPSENFCQMFDCLWSQDQ